MPTSGWENKKDGLELQWCFSFPFSATPVEFFLFENGDVQMKALIFDCDGTLIDTMPTHYLSWEETLAPYGVRFPEDEFYALGGWTAEAIVQRLFERAGISVDPAQVAREKDENYKRYEHTIQPLEPIARIARGAYGTVPMAVGTGGTRDFCTRALIRTGLLELFEVLVCAEDVVRGKPAPETFLLCATQLQVHPSDCLVYEDTDAGIEAARRAGMKWVDIREVLRVENLRKSGSSNEEV